MPMPAEDRRRLLPAQASGHASVMQEREASRRKRASRLTMPSSLTKVRVKKLVC